jgi:hypothetical protein
LTSVEKRLKRVFLSEGFQPGLLLHSGRGSVEGLGEDVVEELLVSEVLASLTRVVVDATIFIFVED